MMPITKFLHAALLVTNLEQAKHFYGTVLGLPEIERNLKYPGAWYQVGEFQFHLIACPTVPPSEVNREKLGQNRHLAFAVTDLETLKTRLEAEGYTVQMSASGRPALFTQDPEGNVIELGVFAGEAQQ